ncbi:MAG: potassium channel family protein [Pyrinomonadaceae bacterium]|nr:potassium channel family protein [Pyrinomonadaceae bacterium]
MLRGLIASFILVSLCVVIHSLGLVLLADWLINHPLRTNPQFSIRRYTSLLISVFAFITLLHLVETVVWAGFYYWWGHFRDFETSWYFSLGSYTTIGYGDVLLPAMWRMLGGIEGINGVLLCGLSTAFLFVIVNNMFRTRWRHRSTRSTSEAETTLVSDRTSS